MKKNKVECWSITCYTVVIFTGFTKCGTSDIFHKLNAHHLFAGGYRIGKVKKQISLKEVHFWDNTYKIKNKTFKTYSSLYGRQIISSFKKYGNTSKNYKPLKNDWRDLVYCDATPRTVWHGYDWEKNPTNAAVKEPKILLAHKIHHILPDAKIILSLRNPTQRLISDFNNFHPDNNKTADMFHKKVVAITIKSVVRSTFSLAYTG